MGYAKTKSTYGAMIKEGDWVIRWVTTYQEDLASFMAKMCQGLGSRIRRVGKSKKESPLMPYCLKQHTNTVSQNNWWNTLGYMMEYWWTVFKILTRFRVFCQLHQLNIGQCKTDAQKRFVPSEISLSAFVLHKCMGVSVQEMADWEKCQVRLRVGWSCIVSKLESSLRTPQATGD